MMRMTLVFFGKLHNNVLLKCIHFFVNRFAGLGVAEGHLMKKKINHGFGQQLVHHKTSIL